MIYQISYTHTLGNASLVCKAWEISSILSNMMRLATQGHKFSHVTIKTI